MVYNFESISGCIYFFEPFYDCVEDMTKPREWWISEYTYSNYIETDVNPPELSDPTRRTTQVIDKAAYDHLEQENMLLKEKLDSLNDEKFQHCEGDVPTVHDVERMRLREENAKLQAEIERLSEQYEVAQNQLNQMSWYAKREDIDVSGQYVAMPVERESEYLALKNIAESYNTKCAKALEAIEKAEAYISGMAMTCYPINVRELDGSISQHRPKSGAGFAMDFIAEARAALEGE